MEEQAWLVRARSDSERSCKLGFGSTDRTMTYTEDRLTETDAAGEPGNSAAAASAQPEAHDNDSGELLDYNDSSVLEQFHEDALRQAGFGLGQGRVMLACALGVIGASLELSAIPFILPSAEIELCIQPHENNWLVLISLVGCCVGAAGWGALGERLGRRRALLSALAVNAVFAAVAAFMPTYGTFMMARFCSAIGSGGIVPAAYTYVAEMTPREYRRRVMAWLVMIGGMGALTAAVLAEVVLPPTGELTLAENKQHFSAWHRYLLLCMLPLLASLASLVWTQESPRYLVDAGREVDAMQVYQSLHRSNQLKIGCGAARARAAAAAAGCRLGELALPGKRRPQQARSPQHMFCQAFLQLFSSAYRNTTLCLGGTLLFTTAIQFCLSCYVPALISHQQSALFAMSRRNYRNATYTNVTYNETLQNQEYVGVNFTKCAFKDMLMSHVLFQNCTFTEVAFSNVKTSYTSFGGCTFVNSTIIDADMAIGRELDEWCVLNNTSILGMQGGCNRHADLTSTLEPLIHEQIYVSHAMIIAAVWAMLPRKLRPLVVLCGICILLSPSLYFVQSETALYVVEAAFRVFLTLILFNVSVAVIEGYPANLRCTAFGLILSVCYLGAAVTRGAGDGGPLPTSILCCCLGAAATLLATRLRY